jgi:asparagine synthase (glutamine-hydrolysing)
LLDSMRDRLSHRGPDGFDSWIAPTATGSVGLAHRRLAILDLSPQASQPMASADGQTMITYNGEIYNFVELRDELQALGASFRTRSDTEVLLAAYERWGDDCLTKINGMFAFAIWDGRRRRMFAARDRFGEKPLFHVALPGGGIALASEIKALTAHPDIPVRSNDSVIARFASGLYCEDSEQTFFAGIQRLPPAHAMEIDPNGRVLRKWRYWAPDYTPARERYDERTAARAFLDKLERSVRMRLRSDVPVGTSLSGGLDSSSLVCLIAREREAGSVVTQNVFSARFDADPTLSEGPQIDTVVRHTGVRTYAVTPEPSELMRESAAMHWHHEEPTQSASMYLQWCVARLAKENGTTVLIDGQGADELLGGYQFYYPTYQQDLLDRGELLTLCRESWQFTRRLRRLAADYDDARRRFNPAVALDWRALLRCWLKPRPVIAGAYATGVPAARRGARLRRLLAEAVQYTNLPLLLRYADRNAMAFGVESRFPFLDYELVDWVTSLPDAAFIRDGWQKRILRVAMNGILPPSIQWRVDKMGYAAPQDLWLRGRLREWARERIFSELVRDVPGYDAAALQRDWDTHQAGMGDLSWNFWRWISLSEWFALKKSGAWKACVGATAA